MGLAREAWDSLKYALEGRLLSSVNAGLELGDVSLQDCFHNAKVPFSQYEDSRDCVQGRAGLPSHVRSRPLLSSMVLLCDAGSCCFLEGWPEDAVVLWREKLWNEACPGGTGGEGWDCVARGASSLLLLVVRQ